MTITIADAIWTKDEKTHDDQSICCKIVLRKQQRDDSKLDQFQVFELDYRGASSACQDHCHWLTEIVSATTATTTRVYYLSNNSIDFFLSVLACHYGDDKSQLRLLPVLLNTRWTVSEISEALQMMQQNSAEKPSSAYILYGNGFEQVAKQVAQKLDWISCHPIPNFATTYYRKQQNWLHRPQKVQNSEQKVAAASESIASLSSEDAMIVFTSGTSGAPKGVRLSHRAIIVQSRTKCQLLYNTNTQVLANLPPFFHVGGLSSILAVWMAGGTLVLFMQPSSEFSSVQTSISIDASWILRQSLPWVNTLVVVPTMLYMLQQTLDNNKNGSSLANVQFLHMRLILIGGQSASASQLEFVRSIFPRARIVQTYACTEAASSLTFLDVTKASPPSPMQKQHQQISGLQMLPQEEQYTGDCVGHPAPHVEMAIFRIGNANSKNHVEDRSDNGIIHQPFVYGVLATRGPHVMNGYYGQTPFNDGSSINTSHAWFRTSDIGYRDQHGQFYLVGRITDSIRTGGETVYATEVEKVLLRHPDVAECSVFGIPDDRLGELVCCALIPTSMRNNKLHKPSKSLTSLSLENIRSWCSKHGMANYKHPRRILYLESLPQTTSGKVVKSQLAACFRSQCSKL